jgi:hypothetical protein
MKLEILELGSLSGSPDVKELLPRAGHGEPFFVASDEG